jgi:hypothetical protein
MQCNNSCIAHLAVCAVHLSHILFKDLPQLSLGKKCARHGRSRVRVKYVCRVAWLAGGRACRGGAYYCARPFCYDASKQQAATLRSSQFVILVIFARLTSFSLLTPCSPCIASCVRKKYCFANHDACKWSQGSHVTDVNIGPYSSICDWSAETLVYDRLWRIEATNVDHGCKVRK